MVHAFAFTLRGPTSREWLNPFHYRYDRWHGKFGWQRAGRKPLAIWFRASSMVIHERSSVCVLYKVSGWTEIRGLHTQWPGFAYCTERYLFLLVRLVHLLPRTPLRANTAGGKILSVRGRRSTMFVQPRHNIIHFSQLVHLLLCMLCRARSADGEFRAVVLARRSMRKKIPQPNQHVTKITSLCMEIRFTEWREV